MDSLEAEIAAEARSLDVRIVGVNEIGQESGNPLIAPLCELPWLQDTEAQRVWERWEPSYRDVIVLDEENERVAVFNVTTYDLGTPANFDSLKTLLTGIAAGR